ncbi:hypothetical protein CEXT_181591 [Caerostris extrusa]|uniref:Uncharacterized protein n=1 Tax=Caerostris extrusa TaxID=172846 RepID=A0AAV4VXY3_CAEEX|nr:hypothetical protein CEXT_181591 [Caerostris extrusa]
MSPTRSNTPNVEMNKLHDPSLSCEWVPGITFPYSTTKFGEFYHMFPHSNNHSVVTARAGAYASCILMSLLFATFPGLSHIDDQIAGPKSLVSQSDSSSLTVEKRHPLVDYEFIQFLIQTEFVEQKALIASGEDFKCNHLVTLSR